MASRANEKDGAAEPRGTAGRVGLAIPILSLSLAAWALPALQGNWPILLPVWLSFLGLLVLGSLLVGKIHATGPPPAGGALRPLHLVLLAGCLTLGIFFRLYRIRAIPPGVFIDETNGALDALRILEGDRVSPFGVGWFETPSLYAYYMAGIFKIGGIHFWTLKAASLLPAILTIVALIPLAVFLFGPRVAVLATFLLAVSRWHVTLSRWGWNELMPPLFQIVATYLLLRALVFERAVEFVAAGIVLGLCMYTYLGSRLVVGVTAAYLLYRIVFERGFFRRHWRGLLLFALGYVICFAPLATTYLRDSSAFLHRSQQVSILRDVEHAGSWSPLRENAIRHVRMFRGTGDGNGRHNLPGEPMLSFSSGLLFLAGLLLALRRIRDHRFALLLLWVTVTIQGGILSTLHEGPQAYRTIGLVPAICLLSAVAADEALRATGNRAGLRRLVLLLVVVALGYDAYWSYRIYFGPQAQNESVWAGFNPFENSIGRRLMTERALNGGVAHVYLDHRFYYFSPVRFFLHRPREGGHGGLDDPEFRLFVPERDIPLPAEPARDLLLLLEARNSAGADLIKHYYPHAVARKIIERVSPLYLEVIVPHSDVLPLEGLTAVDTDEKPLAETNAGASLDERLSHLARSQALVGAMLAPASESYCVQPSGPIDVKIDGRPMRGAVFLAQGLHDLRVIRGAGNGAARLSIAAEGNGVRPIRFYRTSAPRIGLRGRYFAAQDWSRPVFDRIDPVLSFVWPEEEPLRGAFSVRWEGQLKIAEAGSYEFELDCDDGCGMTVDGQVFGSALKEGPQLVKVRHDLAAGLHDVRVDYFQAGGAKHFELRWRPPNREMEVIPSSALLPAEVEPPRSSEGTCLAS